MQIITSALRFQSGPQTPQTLAPYVWHLGATTRLNPYDGNVMLNVGLVESLVKHREKVIPPLAQLLATSMQPLQIVEGLYLAQRLAEVQAPGVKSLYAAAARFNHTTDPLIQVYLAGFYRKLNVPDSFGPMVEMLLRQARQPQTPRGSAGPNPAEEIGGTILQQIANHSADEVMRRLRAGG